MKREHLEIGDLPLDETGAFRTFRPELIKSFNKARQYPERIKLLKETMKYLYNACVAVEKSAAVAVKEVSDAPITDEKGAK